MMSRLTSAGTSARRARLSAKRLLSRSKVVEGSSRASLPSKWLSFREPLIENEELGIRNEELGESKEPCIVFVENDALMLPLAPWSWAEREVLSPLMLALMPDFWSMYVADRLLIITSLTCSRSNREVDVVSSSSSFDVRATML